MSSGKEQHLMCSRKLRMRGRTLAFWLLWRFAFWLECLLVGTHCLCVCVCVCVWLPSLVLFPVVLFFILPLPFAVLFFAGGPTSACWLSFRPWLLSWFFGFGFPLDTFHGSAVGFFLYVTICGPFQGCQRGFRLTIRLGLFDSEL